MTASKLGTLMAFFPVFLSIFFVVRNQASAIELMLSKAANVNSGLVSNFELIVVDNESDDGRVAVFKRLTAEIGQANLQVYALRKEVDGDTALWVDLENPLGAHQHFTPRRVGVS